MGAGQIGLAAILDEPALEEKQCRREDKAEDRLEVGQLMARINWLEESLQQEEEVRAAAENQAESLRMACEEQAGKVDDLSEQISMLFHELDEQQKSWTSLEAKLEFEHHERLQIEAALKALATGFLTNSVQQSELQNQDAKTVTMFKELNSEWSNYKSTGKLSWAKLLRRLNFSRRASSKNSTNEGRAYDTAKLTEEIFSLNSEACEVRQRHLAELTKKLEIQHQSGQESSSWSKTAKKRTVIGGSQKKNNLESDSNKSHFKIESLGRQVVHLKKLCTEKTQLVKLEKRRRSELENRYYMLVKNLEKQVMQLRKLNLRKADEIKQERCRRQEAEKKSVLEVESLERQVVRLSKLAEARGHDFKHEQKQRIDAQRRLKDLVAQRQTKSSKSVKQAKNSAPLGGLLKGEEAEYVELEGLQLRTLGDSSCSERHVWRLEMMRQRGRFVLTQLPIRSSEHCLPPKSQIATNLEHSLSKLFLSGSASQQPQGAEQVQEAEQQTKQPVQHERKEDEAVHTTVLEESEQVLGMESVQRTGADQIQEEPEDKSSVSVVGMAWSDTTGSLTEKIFQLKKTTSRLLKDLEGTQMVMSGRSTEGKDITRNASPRRHGSRDGQVFQLRRAFRKWKLAGGKDKEFVGGVQLCRFSVEVLEREVKRLFIDSGRRTRNVLWCFMSQVSSSGESSTPEGFF